MLPLRVRDGCRDPECSARPADGHAGGKRHARHDRFTAGAIEGARSAEIAANPRPFAPGAWRGAQNPRVGASIVDAIESPVGAVLSEQSLQPSEAGVDHSADHGARWAAELHGANWL